MSIGNTYPWCKHCEDSMLDYDNFEFEDCDGDTVYFRCEGHCPKCGRTYVWRDYYDFGGVYEVEENSNVDF